MFLFIFYYLFVRVYVKALNSVILEADNFLSLLSLFCTCVRESQRDLILFAFL